MAIKYYINYFDVVDVNHRLNIYDDSYDGEAIQVDGNVTITYSETDSNLESIRGQGLRVELEANKDLTFENLWSENEQTYLVEYKRNDVILFNGWLNPEGFFESYVNTDWIVSFDCVDGFGYLTDLAFVDSDGFPITGRKSEIEVLAIALQRTGILQRINTAIDIRYVGLADDLDPLINTFVNVERYYKDDDETIMSCEEVIRDILEPYCATITSFAGEWYIYKANQLYLDTSVEFFQYLYNGIPLVDKVTLDFSQTIGSDWKGFYPHHCSANQTIKNVSSISAYRINYKYGLATDLVDNEEFYSADGVTLADWSISDSVNVVLPGVGLSGVTLIASNDSGIQLPILISNPMSIISNVNLQIKIKFSSNISNLFANANVRFTVQLQGDLNTYQLEEDGNWVDTGGYGLNYAMTRFTPSTIVLESSPTPEAGTIFIILERPYVDIGTADIFLTLFSILNLTDAPSGLIGEFHTVQRLSKPSSQIENVKEVATGDNVSDIYEGTIYKADSITPTDYWYRKGITESKPLLQIMGEETLRMTQLPSRVFSGDVYGYFNYLSIVTIDGFNGLFMPIKYEYDTRSNIISAEFRQLFGDELGDDINYEKTYDYGNTVEPTII